MEVLHVEVLQKRSSLASRELVERLVRDYLSNMASVTAGSILRGVDIEQGCACAELAAHVDSVALCDAEHEAGAELAQPELCVRVVSAAGTDGPVRTTPAPCSDDAGDGPPAGAGPLDEWALPHAALHGLWESLVFEDSLKADVLRFVETAFEFEASGVDARQVAWSRVVLLHGPPGTGKTSLCRALAHKLAVRLESRFPRARLLEINAHGLFSKWFSESGKIVNRLFDHIHEILEDSKLLVCVLVDEVESLAAARRAAAAGLEPSDSIRAVNAVLGALDRLRRAPNALVLATSNVTAAIDDAFLDRADLLRRVPPPGPRAAYAVLRAALAELMARGLLRREPLFSWRVLDAVGAVDSADTAAASLRLRAVAAAAAARGVSGRALRRLPFLARALYARGPRGLDAAQFVTALEAALQQHLQDVADLREDHVLLLPAPPAPAPPRTFPE